MIFEEQEQEQVQEQEQEQAQEQVQEQEQEQEQEQSNLIDVINASWESKLLKMTTDYEKRLAERDNVIKQLITNGKTDNDSKGDTIIDKINAQRNYKKW